MDNVSLDQQTHTERTQRTNAAIFVGLSVLAALPVTLPGLIMMARHANADSDIELRTNTHSCWVDSVGESFFLNHEVLKWSLYASAVQSVLSIILAMFAPSNKPGERDCKIGKLVCVLSSLQLLVVVMGLYILNRPNSFLESTLYQTADGDQWTQWNTAEENKDVGQRKGVCFESPPSKGLLSFMTLLWSLSIAGAVMNVYLYHTM
jgi:NADH:ubiquinone oxidoreductase subunit 6 (subunit J)